MKKRYVLLPVFTLLASLSALSQDVHFSQFAETPSIINPALAGTTYNTRVGVNFKDQWSSVASRFRTFGLSFEQTIKHKKLKDNYFAVAFNVFRDEAGDARLRVLNPNLGVAYLQKINKNMLLSGGLQGGFNYKTIDLSSLRWGAQYDGYSYNEALPTGEPETPRSSITSFDMGGGVNLNYVRNEKYLTASNRIKFDAGFAAYHYQLGRSSFITSTERLNTRFDVYFNGDFSIPNSMNAIMPSILYMQQGGQAELIAGALFKFILGDPSTYTSLKKPRSLAIGGYYRVADAIIPTMLVQLNQYAIGLAYDINISSLTPASNRRGGLELMARYNLFPGYGVNLGRRDAKPSY